MSEEEQQCVPDSLGDIDDQVDDLGNQDEECEDQLVKLIETPSQLGWGHLTAAKLSLLACVRQNCHMRNTTCHMLTTTICWHA